MDIEDEDILAKRAEPENYFEDDIEDVGENISNNIRNSRENIEEKIKISTEDGMRDDTEDMRESTVREDTIQGDTERNPRNPTDYMQNDMDKGSKKKGGVAKVMAVFFCITTIASVGALVYTMQNMNSQKNKLDSDLKQSKEEVKKANEIISQYEDATKTKASEVKDNNTAIKEIIKPAVYDIKYQQLINSLGQDKLVRGGQIFTNKAGTYAFASLNIGGINKQKDQFGQDIDVISIGGGVEEYYRELPNGDWKFAFGGQIIQKCSDFSATIRSIYHDVDHPDSKNNYTCMKSNNPNDTEHL